VYSRKPTPAFNSGEYPDWDKLRQDAKLTLDSGKNVNVEFLL